MKLSNIEYINSSKFFGFDLEYKGQTYKIYVREMYHKNTNFTQRDIDVMPEEPSLERNTTFYPEIKKYILDNIDDILKAGE